MCGLPSRRKWEIFELYFTMLKRLVVVFPIIGADLLQHRTFEFQLKIILEDKRGHFLEVFFVRILEL